LRVRCLRKHPIYTAQSTAQCISSEFRYDRAASTAANEKPSHNDLPTTPAPAHLTPHTASPEEIEIQNLDNVPLDPHNYPELSAVPTLIQIPKSPQYLVSSCLRVSSPYGAPAASLHSLSCDNNHHHHHHHHHHR
jgi:hypothetical protein